MRPTLKKFAAALLLATVAASCATSPTHDKASTSSRPVPRGPHSQMADIYLPPGATMAPQSDYAKGKLEMWHIPWDSLGEATQAMNLLLPVNQPLDGLPWCGSTTASGSTYWAWGTSTEELRVDVSEIMWGDVFITIKRFAPTNGVCTPRG